jgi:hypothetical protein
MKQQRRHKILFMCAVMALVFAVPPRTAGADPTPAPAPAPDPGYQIAGPSGPVVGGLRTLPPICGVQPRACAGKWNPDTGAWDFPPGT